jgi:AcrR family transcriptional regulator
VFITILLSTNYSLNKTGAIAKLTDYQAAKDSKEKIYQAALELVTSEAGLESITTREIARKANVNLALINYYYQSKENLLSQVIETKMESIIEQVIESSAADTDAATKLKKLLTTTADFSFRYNKIFRIAVAKELKEGCRSSCMLFIPLLKEIYRDKSDEEIRIIALQLLLPFLNIVQYPEIYNVYLNTDFFDRQKRNQKINQMTENVLSGK